MLCMGKWVGLLMRIVTTLQSLEEMQVVLWLLQENHWLESQLKDAHIKSSWRKFWAMCFRGVWSWSRGTRPEEAQDVVLDDDHKDQTHLDAHEEESAYDVTVQGLKLKDVQSRPVIGVTKHHRQDTSWMNMWKFLTPGQSKKIIPNHVHV